MRTPMLLLTSIVFLSPLAAAESMHLTKSGGAVGGDLTLGLEGTPGRPYVLLFDDHETRIRLPGGEFLDVDPRFAPISTLLPGFTGALDGAGRAQAHLTLPNLPLLASVVITVQALATDTFDAVSNRVRVTPAVHETFSPALSAPALPVTGPGLAARLADGKVWLFSSLSLAAQLYDGDLEAFTPGSSFCLGGLLTSMTALPDGRIFIAGGLGIDGQPTDRCALFDPASGGCTAYHMSRPRAGHAAALTARGEVLITGGFDVLDLADLLAFFGGITSSTELFDPSTGTFRPGPSMLEPKAFHTATTTAPGNVLVAGGLTLLPILDVPLVSNTAYEFDAGFDSFGLLPVLFSTGRMLHSAALLDNGRVLLAGGVNIDFSLFLQTGNIADLSIAAVSSGERWQDGLFGGRFDAIPGLQTGRALPAVVALTGAEALVAGGFQLRITGDLTQLEFAPLATADLLVGNAFRPTGAMEAARIAPIGTRLSDGTVLVVGGGAGSAEIYQR